MTVITGITGGGSSVPAIQIAVTYDLVYNAAGGANAVSQAFGAGTELIEVAAHIVGSGIRIVISAAPDATVAGSKLLPGSGSWFFVVHPGWKIAAISDDSNAGYINITEAASWG